MAKDAYAIEQGFLSVKAGDITLTGNVVDVVVETHDHYDDAFTNAIRVQPQEYTLTARFVPDDLGTSITIAKKKTTVSHEATVVVDECDIESVVKAVKATGAPAEHTVSTRLISVDGAIKSRVTVAWEENK